MRTNAVVVVEHLVTLFEAVELSLAVYVFINEPSSLALIG